MARRLINVPGRFYSVAQGIDLGPAGEFAVDFADTEKSGVYREVSNISGMVDSKVGLCSLWFYYSTTVNATQFMFTVDASNSENAVIQVHTDSNRRLNILMRTNALSNAWIFLNAAAPLSATPAWHHLLMSWDTEADVGYVYVDDTDYWTAATNVVTDDALIGYSRANERFTIAGGDYIGSNWQECLAQFWFDSNQFLDITVAANRRLFINADLSPVRLGPTGATPTGTSPLIYLDNPAASFATNRGTGGDFTEFGTLADCADSPLNQA